MSKKPNPLEPITEKLDGIEAAANDAAASASAQPESERIDALEQRLASMEAIMEQLASNAKLGPKLEEYIGDLRTEQVFFNEARWAVGAIAFFAILILSILLALALFSQESPLLRAQPSTIAAFVLGIISGIVFLINSFIKGVFRSATDRHADGFLPPALEKVAELYGKVSGRP